MTIHFYPGITDLKNVKVILNRFDDSNEVLINDELLDPALSLRIINHSPTGFEWGYGGGGPAQLALAILLKFFPVEMALILYQDFKEEVVATWERDAVNLMLYVDIRKWAMLKIHSKK